MQGYEVEIGTSDDFPSKVSMRRPEDLDLFDIDDRPIEWAVINASADRLFALFANEFREAGLPSRYKLDKLENAIKAGRKIDTPILQVNNNLPPDQAELGDGRHRVTLLKALGAKFVPVCVRKQLEGPFREYFEAR